MLESKYLTKLALQWNTVIFTQTLDLESLSVVPGTTAVLMSSCIHENKMVGVLIGDKASVTVEDCNIHSSTHCSKA